MKGRSVTTAIYQDAAKKKDGTQTLYLRLTIDRKMRTFPTGIAIPAKFWNKERQEIKLNVSGLANARELAAKLASKKAELDKLILEIQSCGEDVTFASVQRKTETKGRTLLLDYCNWRLESDASSRAKATTCSHRSQIGILRRYDPDVTISGITPAWLEEYQKHLFNEGRLSHNSILTNFRYLEKILNHASKHGAIQSNPFKFFKKVSWKAVEKTYLTKEELATLQRLYHTGGLRKAGKIESPSSLDGLHHTLQQFLASCFTGLRYSDIAKLHPDDFTGDYFSIVIKKTAKPTRIPINAPLRSLLCLQEGTTSVFLGKVAGNVQSNLRLREITRLAGIKKHLTFHSARHTFAIMALEVGIPIEVVSNILGHSTLAMTQVYARVVDSQKAREMQKMDAFAYVPQDGNG